MDIRYLKLMACHYCELLLNAPSSLNEHITLAVSIYAVRIFANNTVYLAEHWPHGFMLILTAHTCRKIYTYRKDLR